MRTTLTCVLLSASRRAGTKVHFHEITGRDGGGGEKGSNFARVNNPTRSLNRDPLQSCVILYQRLNKDLWEAKR